MRITNNMMISNMMRNLNRNMQRLDKRMMQAATGKRIHKPSDDPVAISRSMRVKTDISQLYQYNKNVDDAISWLETSELAANNTNEAVHRLRELMVQAANGVLTAEETTKVQEEVKQLKEQIISLANTTYGSSYIFSGKKSDQPLFDTYGNYLVDLIDYKNPAFNDDRQNIQVGSKENLGVNTLGFELFEAFEKPVVYSGDLSALPLADTVSTDIVLELEPGKPITLKVTGGVAGDISIIDNYNAEVSIDHTGDIEAQIKDIIGAFKKMGEEYNSPLKGYDFETFESNVFDGTTVNYDVLQIKATPKDAIAVDKRDIPAVWETGEITPPVTGEATFTFMGVRINITTGTIAGDFAIDESSVSKNGATIVISDALTTDDDKREAIQNALKGAFEKVAGENGSKIAGFTFEVAGDGLRVIAPVGSGPMHNKETFGGTLELENETHLVVKGDAEKRTIAAGQKSGIVQLIEDLEKELLAGNTEEINKKLGVIDKYHQNLVRGKAEIGAKVNRMDLVKNRIADDTINFKTLLSQLEDADMAEVLMELMNEENVYRSSLSIGARIIQPTLLDFLR